MTEPGDRRPREGSVTVSDPAPQRDDPFGPPGRSLAMALLLALGVVLLSAAAWALLRGVLDLGVGLVAVAVLGGWGIGAVIRSANGSALLAAGIAAGAWLLGLIGTWLVSMAILQGSTRTVVERLEATPFTDWISPQFGALEIIGLIVYVGAALYGSRRQARIRSN